MNCKRCGGKGFVETAQMRGASTEGFATIAQCCDISKYSEEVSKRLNARLRVPENDENKARRELGFENVGVVLPFKRRNRSD